MTDEVSYLNLFCVNWWLLMCHIKFISLPYELNGWLARWTEAACITLWIEGFHCLCMNWSCMYSSLNWRVALRVYELKLHVFLSELKGSIVCVWTEAAWRSRRWWRSSSPWCWSSSAWRWFGWRSGRWWSVMGKGEIRATCINQSITFIISYHVFLKTFSYENIYYIYASLRDSWGLFEYIMRSLV